MHNAWDDIYIYSYIVAVDYWEIMDKNMKTTYHPAKEYV